MTGKDTDGRTVNVKRNITYGMLQIAASRFFPFCTRTVLIYRFGVDYLGLNSLFTSVLSTLSLMELGFGTAIVYSMYKPVAEGDTDRICAYLAYYRKIYRFIGLSILAVGLLLMPFLHKLIRDPFLPGDLNLYVCYLIFLGNSVIGYLLYGYMSAIPMAYQRRDILSRIEMGVSLLSCIVKISILTTTHCFYLYLISIPAITIISNLLTLHVTRKMYPELVIHGEITLDQKHDLKKKVSGILVTKVTSVSRNSIDTLCISAFIGLFVTGIYDNYYLIMSSMLSGSVMICDSMMASVGNSIAVEHRNKNYSDMRLFDFMYMTIAGWSTTCMLCLYQPFIFVWVGSERMLSTPIVFAFCVYYYILLSGAIRWVYQEGAGLWWECRYIMIGEAVANVVLNIAFCRIWGVAGIITATILSIFITNFILCPRIVFKEYFKNNKLHEYWMDHIWYTATSMLIGGTSWLICDALFPMALTAGKDILKCIACLGGRLFVCTVISGGIWWIIWHRSERFINTLKWIRKSTFV